MTFKTFIKNINAFAKEHPETLEMEVITSKDDEGNGYNFIHYTPSKGFYDKKDREYHQVDSYEDWGIDDSSTNAVCVN